MKKIVILLLLIFCLASLVADNTEFEEHFIYSIHSYDGSGHKQTFSNQHTDSIYFIADSENIISTRKAFIYYFPSMERWRIDSTKLNYPLPGTIEITGKKGFRKILEKVDYTYMRTSTRFNTISQILLREEALEKYAEYSKELEEYEAELKRFVKIREDFAEWQDDMNAKIREARKAGKDVTGLVNEIKTRMPPYPEKARPEYTVAEPLEAYYVKLPEGNYTMRFIDEQGDVMEGSEKKLIVFALGQVNSVGYEYSSRDKILKPRNSREPKSVIYVDGSNDLFFRSIYQTLFTDFHYKKLAINDSNGNPDLKIWVKTGIVEYSWMETKYKKKRDILVEEYFKYQQDPNNMNTYEIVYYDQSDKHRFQSPDFSSFLLKIGDKDKVMNIHLKDMQGNFLAGSDREIRVIRKVPNLLFFFIIGLIPLGVMIYVLIKRYLLYKSAV